ncbi:MAG: DUF6686 family protein [Bacteroidota bacterium]
MHNENDTFQILAECDHGYIGVCRCCWEFNYTYKNILLTFQEPDMRDFFDWIIECRRNGSVLLPLPCGSRHVYKSPLYNMFLVHTDEELNEIEIMYNEVKVMLETMKILF